MRAILQRPGLRYVFAANLISMLGSGMNAAAVAWYILQATHSEVSLGTLIVVQTIPAMLILPFTGVIIDREDRRRLVMMLDATRGIVILTVAILAFLGKAKIWELYLMNMLVSAGFWMFWPTITALIQELTPGENFVHSNSMLMAGVQGGWLLAGAVVGFVYNHIGLGGVLLIDFSTYVVSFLCYFAVRKGHHVVPRPAELHADLIAAETSIGKFAREMKEGWQFIHARPSLILLGAGWAAFLGAMQTGLIVTPALSDKVFHAGAVGYGWLNAGWGVGSFFSALMASRLISAVGARRSIGIALGVLTAGMILVPRAPWLAVAVASYGVMGVGRGFSGVGLNTVLMEQVPKHFMGRVQNTFYFAGTAAQIGLAMLVGGIAQLNLAAGFTIIGLAYLVGFVSVNWPVRTVEPVAAVAE